MDRIAGSPQSYEVDLWGRKRWSEVGQIPTQSRNAHEVTTLAEQNLNCKMQIDFPHPQPLCPIIVIARSSRDEAISYSPHTLEIAPFGHSQ